MNIQTLELFQWADIQEDGKTIQTRVLRHTLVQPNGLIYFQDEYVKLYTPAMSISSERTPWSQLEVPAIPDEPIGVFSYGGLFGAVMRSGKAYIYAAKVPDENDEDAVTAYNLFQRAHRIHEWPHEWVKFAGAVPETFSYVAENG